MGAVRGSGPAAWIKMRDRLLWRGWIDWAEFLLRALVSRFMEPAVALLLLSSRPSAALLTV